MDRPDQPYVFPARIQKIWIMRCIDIPADIAKAIRGIAGKNVLHIPVHGWIEGLPFQNTLVPRGGGHFRMHVNSKIWRKLGIDAGAAVEVTMLLDTEPRKVVLPPDLAAALSATPHALDAFNAQTIALRGHIIDWVNAAKQSRTRDKRVQLVLRRMQEHDAKQRRKLVGKKESARKGSRAKVRKH
jgi:Bacteriocin-protection, YdeI or OmpD-Associated/Domain of unknown function (DUF1905)